MDDPNVSEADFNKALKADVGIVNAEIQAENARIESAVKALTLSPGDEGKINNFAAKAGTLKSSIEAYSTSVGGDKSGFLGKVSAIRNGTAITSAQQDDLNKSALSFVKSMGIGKTVNGIQTGAPLDVLNMFKEAGISVKANSEISVAKGFQSLIEQLRINSVELSEEQQKLFGTTLQNASDPAGLF